MNDEKIIELAAQFDDDSPEFAMSTEAVIAFAQALIDARLAEDGDEPFLWVETDENGKLNWDVTCTFSDSPAFLAGRPIPLYRCPQPKARLTGEEILETAGDSSPVYPWMVQGDVTLGYLRKSAIDFALAIERKIWGKAE
jgi:hypothetical protein